MHVFQVRREYIEARQKADSAKKELQHLRKVNVARTYNWHKSFELMGQSTPFTKKCLQHRLNKTEREILAALLLNQLALVEKGINSCKELLEFLGLTSTQVIPAMRMLSEHGRLYRAKILSFDDPEYDLAIRTPVVDSALVDVILSQNSELATGWKVKNERELFDRLNNLTRALMKKSDCLRDLSFGLGNERLSRKWTRQVTRLLIDLEQTLSQHPRWKLAEIQNEIPHSAEFTIFLALLGKHLGHAAADDCLFTGGGLARAVSDEMFEVITNLRLLSPDKNLAQKGFISPCGGDVELASNDDSSLETMEFELTAKAVELLGIEKHAFINRKCDFQARKPILRLEQMVLSEKVRLALNMALIHARYGRQLIDDWGLGEIIPYGRSPVLLFSGPPGTGKSATAEAMAQELGKAILVVDYSRI